MMSADHKSRLPAVVVALVLTLASAGRAEQPSEPNTTIAADLPHQSLALGERSLSCRTGHHEFVLARSWTIGLLLISGQGRSTLELSQVRSMWDMADAALPASHLEPTRAEQQFRTFWPSSLRLALMNKDLPLWALEAIDVDLERWHWYNARSDYWNWRSRYSVNDWPRNAASEFFSLGNILPPK